MIKTFVFLAAAASLSTPLLGAGQAPSDAPVKKEKKICREIEGVSTRMSKKICKTAAEWQGNNAPKAAADRSEGSAAGKAQ
jgi:outer membrane lipoprotein-sorting protein